MSGLIRLEKICRDFQVGDEVVHALQDVNLTIGAGEYISIMGPSGSGKSTLLNILGLLDTPTSGHYWLDDRDVSVLSDNQIAETRQSEIGFVFQFFHLIPRLTALENVELPLTLAGVGKKERHERAALVLEQMGIEDRADHRPDQLSGGQRQRVAIGRAIVMKPGLLLADEPTGNLDSESGAEVIDIIEQLNAEGLSVIVVTHDPTLGARSRRHLLMVDGRIEEDRTDARS